MAIQNTTKNGISFQHNVVLISSVSKKPKRNQHDLDDGSLPYNMATYGLQ